MMKQHRPGPFLPDSILRLFPWPHPMFEEFREIFRPPDPIEARLEQVLRLSSASQRWSGPPPGRREMFRFAAPWPVRAASPEVARLLCRTAARAAPSSLGA